MHRSGMRERSILQTIRANQALTSTKTNHNLAKGAATWQTDAKSCWQVQWRMNSVTKTTLFANMLAKRSGRSQLRYKDVRKRDLKTLNVDLNTCESVASEPPFDL